VNEEDGMESAPLGAYLRELRTSRQVALSRLAERAQISRTTLTRWEAGGSQPRLPELEAVLTALGTSAAERERTLALVQAPRAVRRLREETTTATLRGSLEDAAMPTGGDLLRAMRRRRGLSLEQVAARLRLTPGTVSRWEQGKTFPPLDRREALFDVLGAHPGERAALSSQGLQLFVPRAEEPISLERLEWQLLVLHECAGRGEKTLMDLRLLTLEAQIWPLAGRLRTARRLLAQTYTAHAEWLRTWGRAVESRQCAERALDLVRWEFPPERFWLGAILATVNRDSAARAVEQIRLWLDAAADPAWETALYRELADGLSQCGQFDAALTCIRHARQAAERLSEWLPIRLANEVHVGILLRAGRTGDVLPLLPQDEHPDPHQRVFETYNWVTVLRDLGDRAGAHDWLNRAYAIIREYDMSPEGADALARQL
jgi:transcriptional regulator with XRE-family HTH domain